MTGQQRALFQAKHVAVLVSDICVVMFTSPVLGVMP